MVSVSRLRMQVVLETRFARWRERALSARKTVESISFLSGKSSTMHHDGVPCDRADLHGDIESEPGENNNLRIV